MKLKSVLTAVLVIVVITGFYATLYGVVQQNYRQNANDPQIQAAEDISNTLNKGNTYKDFLTKDKFDMSATLATFILFYSDKGEPLDGSALLDGKVPQPPQGVFDYAKEHGQDRLTWQPKDGVRIAAVVNQYKGQTPGFVLVGRSLREVESREDQLLREVVIAWGATMILLGLSVIVARRLK